jgi:hypothetical protein
MDDGLGQTAGLGHLITQTNFFLFALACFLFEFLKNFRICVFFFFLYILPIVDCKLDVGTEMRDGFGSDVASGSFFLHPMRLPIWRGWIPGEGRQALLQGGLSGHVRSEM